MAYEQLKLDNQLCFRLYTAARLTMGAYHPYLDPLGITYPQYLVMLVLWEHEKQTVMDISHRLQLDTNTVTPLLQRMEKAGLIKRTKGKEDARQRIVTLTDKGLAMQEQAKHIPECLSLKKDGDTCAKSLDKYRDYARALRLLRFFEIKQKISFAI